MSYDNVMHHEYRIPRESTDHRFTALMPDDIVAWGENGQRRGGIITGIDGETISVLREGRTYRIQRKDIIDLHRMPDP